jgi:hypothetical protein
MEILQPSALKSSCHTRPRRTLVNWQPSANWVPGWRPLHNNLVVFSSQAHFQLNCLSRPGSSLHSLVADPVENTASYRPSIVVVDGCLAIDRISFPRKRVYRLLSSNACSFSRSLHSNGTTRYNNKFFQQYQLFDSSTHIPNVFL